MGGGATLAGRPEHGVRREAVAGDCVAAAGMPRTALPMAVARPTGTALPTCRSTSNLLPAKR